MTEAMLWIAPELCLSLGAIILMLVAAWRGDRSADTVTALAIALVLMAGAAMVMMGPAQQPVLGGLLAPDAFAVYAKLLIYFAIIVALSVAPRYFREAHGGEPYKAEYPVLILLATVGAGVMVSAGDFLTLYLGLELQSLASYVLASMMRRDGRSAEAGLKYFVLGALASGILLYGISLLYGFVGTTDFLAMRAILAQGVNPGVAIGLTFVFAGLAFKVAAVPFHMWTPDVYEGAPTPVTLLFASAQKVAAALVFVRVAFVPLGPAIPAWQPIIIFAALASIVWGALGAIGQTNVKRLLAYSSINNIGFVLIGMAAGTEVGVASVLGYLAIYAVTAIGGFLCLLQLRDAQGKVSESLSALAGLSTTQPRMAFAWAVFMFSLAGIPPMFGFWAKYLVFDAATRAGFWGLAAIGIAASVIGAFYYVRVVKIIYFDPPSPSHSAGPVRAVPLGDGAVIAACVLLLIFGYLFIPCLDGWSLDAARALFPVS